MRFASATQIEAQFEVYLRLSRAGPVVVTKNGKPVAVLLAVEDEEELERLLLGYSPRLRQILAGAERATREGWEKAP